MTITLRNYCNCYWKIIRLTAAEHEVKKNSFISHVSTAGIYSMSHFRLFCPSTSVNCPSVEPWLLFGKTISLRAAVCTNVGWDSSVVTATGYALDGPGSNPGVGEIFCNCPHRPCGPPSLLYNGYRVFPAGKERPGREADPSHISSALVKKEYNYTSTPPTGRTACTGHQYLYSTAIPLLPSVPVQYSYTPTPLSTCTVQLYLYSPQCLYSTAIPLLLQWAVRPVQSLSAYTRLQFSFLPLLAK